MLKPVLKNFFGYRTRILEKGLDAVILAKDYDNKFYRIRELVGQVVDIKERNNYNSMDKVKVRFFNNQICETATYLDSDIRVGDLISIFGIVTKNGDKLELQCKCGSIRVYNDFAEAGIINTNKFYKFGYSELSIIEPSTVYNIPIEKLQILEENKIWVYTGNDIKQIEENARKNIENEEVGIIDVTTSTTFSVKEINQENNIESSILNI